MDVSVTRRELLLTLAAAHLPLNPVLGNLSSGALSRDPNSKDLACTSSEDSNNTAHSGNQSVQVLLKEKGIITLPFLKKGEIQALRLRDADGPPVVAVQINTERFFPKLPADVTQAAKEIGVDKIFLVVLAHPEAHAAEGGKILAQFRAGSTYRHLNRSQDKQESDVTFNVRKAILNALTGAFATQGESATLKVSSAVIGGPQFRIKYGYDPK